MIVPDLSQALVRTVICWAVRHITYNYERIY